MATMMMLATSDSGWFGLLFAGFGGLFLLLGLGMAIAQARKIRTYVPTPAIVTSAEVVTKTSGDGNTYTPVVAYEYQTPDGPKQSKKTLPIEYSTSDRRWAERIVARYPTGAAVVAYVHPTDETKVFLVHELSLMPYGFVMFAMVFVCIGTGIALAGMGPANWTDADRLMAVILDWNAVGLACLVHYRFNGGRFSLGPQLTFALYVGLGLIAVIVWDDLRHQPPPAKPSVHVVKHRSRPVHKPTTKGGKP
jgi:hypothetical protein